MYRRTGGYTYGGTYLFCYCDSLLYVFCSPGALARSSARSSVLGVALAAAERRAASSAPAAVVLGMFEPAAGPPSGPVVPHRVAHLSVEEAEEQGHQESLLINQK